MKNTLLILSIIAIAFSCTTDQTDFDQSINIDNLDLSEIPESAIDKDCLRKPGSQGNQ